MTSPEPARPLASDGACWAWLVLMGLCFGAYTWLTRQNGHLHELSALPLWQLSGWLMGAGLAYLFLCRLVRLQRISPNHLTLLLAAGLLLRLMLFASLPVLEDDHYRFRWDGAVLASGYNPYAFAPSQAASHAPGQAPEALSALGQQAGQVLTRVNYPHLRTIYPPLTQAAFALAHMLGGFSLWSWRLVLLLADLAALLLIWRLLLQWRLPQSWLALYWLNPVLLHETYATCHMEALLFGPLLACLLLAHKGRTLGACAALGLGVGIKLWPALLLPLVLRPELKRPRRLVGGALLFGSIALLMLAPMALAGLGGDSGLRAYSQRWEMNDAAFLLLLEAGDLISPLFGSPDVNGGHIARMLCALLVLGWVARLCRSNLRDADWAGVFLSAAAALYLLSPTQFPWYSLWLLPFMALRPSGAFLVLALTLPLYYLRPWFGSRGLSAWFDWGVVWLEFGPVWLMLAWQAWQGRRPWEAEA